MKRWGVVRVLVRRGVTCLNLTFGVDGCFNKRCGACSSTIEISKVR